jgi:hypothetical protein
VSLGFQQSHLESAPPWTADHQYTENPAMQKQEYILNKNQLQAGLDSAAHASAGEPQNRMIISAYDQTAYEYGSNAKRAQMQNAQEAVVQDALGRAQALVAAVAAEVAVAGGAAEAAAIMAATLGPDGRLRLP